MFDGKDFGGFDGNDDGLIDGKDFSVFDGKDDGMFDGKKFGVFDGKDVGIIEDVSLGTLLWIDEEIKLSRDVITVLGVLAGFSGGTSEGDFDCQHISQLFLHRVKRASTSRTE